MFENLSNVTVQGGCYKEPTTLEKLLDRRLNILYGRNGSGKSSLAKAFHGYATQDASCPFSLDLGKDVSPKERESIKVFDEEYIKDNVQLVGDELGAIVMLGQEVNIERETSRLFQAVSEILTKQEETQGELEKTQQELSSIEGTIKQNFSKTGKCEERYQIIRNNKTHRPIVINDVISARANTQGFTDDIAALSNEVQSGIRLLKQGRSGETLAWNPPTLWKGQVIDEACELLRKELRQPELSQAEQDLIRLVTEQYRYLEEAQHTLIDRKATRCPLCQQPLTADYLEILSQRISQIINDESKAYKAKLQDALDQLHTVDPQVPAFGNDDYAEHVLRYQQAIYRLNEQISAMRQSIQLKMQNLYGQHIGFDAALIHEAIRQVQEEANQLLKDIAEFNASIERIKELQKELEAKNLWLAYLENENDLKTYSNLCRLIEVLKSDLAEEEQQIEDLHLQINRLDAQRHSSEVALDLINQCLTLVFMDASRMKLVPGEGGNYRLLSRGVPLSPDRISTGERNIIALAYYFASLNQGVDKRSRYTVPVLMIIDDPVSSFDTGNKVGIMSLIKWQLSQFLTSHTTSKALIMSHDQLTIHDLSVLYNDLKYGWKQNNSPIDQDNPQIYELHRKDYRTNNEHGSEYQMMLNNICAFAQSEEPDQMQYLGIGNQMRRVLETFAKMMLNMNYPKALREGKLFESITCQKYYDESYTEYEDRCKRKKALYRQMMMKEVFNSESHSANTIDIDNFEAHFSAAELQKYAQFMLLLMHYYNAAHLYNYLDRQNRHVIKGWVDVLDAV